MKENTKKSIKKLRIIAAILSIMFVIFQIVCINAPEIREVWDKFYWIILIVLIPFDIWSFKLQKRKKGEDKEEKIQNQNNEIINKQIAYFDELLKNGTISQNEYEEKVLEIKSKTKN